MKKTWRRYPPNPAETGGTSGYISGRFGIGYSDFFSFSDDDFVYTDPEAYSPLTRLAVGPSDLNPLGCLWPPVLLRSAWTRLFPLWDRWESAFSTTSTTGSFWPSQRWNYFHTEPSSSATLSAWGSGSISPKAHCLPANEYRSWVQFWTQLTWERW